MIDRHCVVCGELDLNSELPENDVRKSVGVRSEIDRYLELLQQCSDDLANSILKGF